MKRKRNRKNRFQGIAVLLICVIGYVFSAVYDTGTQDVPFDYSQIEEWDESESYQIINNNIPYFTDEHMEMEPFEEYQPLDELGRTQYAMAMLDASMFPDEPRGSIGMIRPSGWQTVRYDDLIDGNYLYNRCHLIAYMLSGQNDNPLNLITGTRYMNVEGMLPWETLVHDHIESTGDSVLYRVTPVYLDDELVARGVLMEAESRDGTLSFCVFVYNVQPGIEIDYSDGTSQVK